MKKQLDFDIDEILRETPPTIIGDKIIYYGHIYIATFHECDNEYEIYALYDTESDYRGICIVQDGIIVNKIGATR